MIIIGKCPKVKIGNNENWIKSQKFLLSKRNCRNYEKSKETEVSKPVNREAQAATDASEKR